MVVRSLVLASSIPACIEDGDDEEVAEASAVSDAAGPDSSAADWTIPRPGPPASLPVSAATPGVDRWRCCGRFGGSSRRSA